MKTRKEREHELRAMMNTADGCQRVLELWKQKVVPPGMVGQIGTVASQVIPLILNSEYGFAVEILKGSGGTLQQIGTVSFDSKRKPECRPVGLLTEEQIQRIADDMNANNVRGRVGDYEWRDLAEE